MENDVVDNQNERLSERLDALLEGANRAHLAVGYFFLEGLAPIQKRIEQLESLEILIGNVVNRLTEEQVREEAKANVRGGEAWVQEQEDVASTLRTTRDRAAAETSLNLRRTLADVPHSLEMRDLALTLANRIADGGLKVRLYTHGRIHAKSALLEYVTEAMPIAVVGSSNVTLGAPSHPTELNVIVRDPESVRSLMAWYQALWERGQDFHRELFDELAQSWALNESSPK